MKLKMKPYPEYRDSGISWLGKIPVHWTAERLKHVCRLEYGDSLAGAVRMPGDVPVFGSNGRVGYHATPNTLDPCIIIGRKGSFGKVNYSTVRAFAIDTTYFVDSRSTREHLRWLFYALAWVRLDDTSKDSAIPGLDRGEAYGKLILRPPLVEQERIATFLDSHDSHINHLIRVKQRLIKLLNEQKRAIIHRAVTRGLDPNVRLKPSDVDWLGDVPEHWEVTRLGRFITLQRGKDITKEQQSNGLVPVVSSGGISSYHNQSTAKGPGVLVGRKGTVGSVYFVQSDYWAHDTSLFVKEFNDNHPKFVYYVLRNLDLKRFDTGSANPTLNRNIVHPEVLAFPARSEQSKIATFLDQRLKQIDSQVRSASLEIVLIREYRTRLVADVVTGKLDVREALVLLPDEVEESDTLNEEEALSSATDETEGVENLAELEE